MSYVHLIIDNKNHLINWLPERVQQNSDPKYRNCAKRQVECSSAYIDIPSHSKDSAVLFGTNSPSELEEFNLRKKHTHTYY